MDNIIVRVVVTAAYLAQTQAPAAGIVPTLLTGGGFVFLGVVMTGLFMWNKNKADSANTVAQGAATWAEGMSKELGAYKNWAGRQRIANKSHSDWDDELMDTVSCLVRQLEDHGIIEKGSVRITHPPTLDVPFDDPHVSTPQIAALRPPSL